MTRPRHVRRVAAAVARAVTPRTLVLTVAIAAGVAAAIFAQHHLQRVAQQLEADARLPMRPVIVAAENLTAGTRLTLDHVAVRQMPEAWLPADVLAPEDQDLVAHAVLQHDLRRGDPVPWAYLVPPPERFSSRLDAGRRAVTIPVDDMNSLAGMLQPDDRIDLFVSFVHQGERVTAPLLQNLRVLATGRQHDAEAEWDAAGRFATVTLDASPDEAVKLIAARQQGTISAMLRHGRDAVAAPSELRGNLAELLGMASPPPPAPAPATRTVPVVFGDRHPAAIPALDDASDPTVEPSLPSAWPVGVPSLGAWPASAQPDWPGLAATDPREVRP